MAGRPSIGTVEANFEQRIFDAFEEAMTSPTICDLKEQYDAKIEERYEGKIIDAFASVSVVKIQYLKKFSQLLHAYERAGHSDKCILLIDEINSIYTHLAIGFVPHEDGYHIHINDTSFNWFKRSIDAYVESADLAADLAADMDEVDSADSADSADDNRRFGEYADRKCRRVDL